jgi:hypothetical protein
MREDILVIPTLGSHLADEVLTYTFTPTQNILPPIATRDALQTLSKALIERTLDAVELNHNRDREDDVYSIFSGEGLPADMTCWYLIVGEDRDILRLLCTVPLPVPQEKWGHVLLTCNQQQLVIEKREVFVQRGGKEFLQGLPHLGEPLEPTPQFGEFVQSGLGPTAPIE